MDMQIKVEKAPSERSQVREAVYHMRLMTNRMFYTGLI